jgi:23S rRNA pseudouridine1911/1915/1917 synthase
MSGFNPASILFEDNHLIVINKPRGLLSQGDRSGSDNLLDALKSYCKDKYQKPGNAFIGLVHRLDRPVSGVMVYAKTSKAASRLSDQVRTKNMRKIYLALVEGALSGSGECRDYLKKVDGRAYKGSSGNALSKLAELEWQALYTAPQHTLLKITLLTGRFHQIRFQMSAMGHPVIGDARYGSRLGKLAGGIALHSWQLSLVHPTSKNEMTFSCLPQGWPVAVEEVLEVG